MLGLGILGIPVVIFAFFAWYLGGTIRSQIRSGAPYRWGGALQVGYWLGKVMSIFGTCALVVIVGIALTNGREPVVPTPTETSTQPETPEPGEYSGWLSGSGTHSMTLAQEAWGAGFQAENPGFAMTYDPDGSGAGFEMFAAGGTEFAGIDSPIDRSDNDPGKFAPCAEDLLVMHLPVSVYAVAITFNIPGVDDLNLNAEILAAIFKGDITSWDSDRIGVLNPDVELPAMPIVPVYRTGNSADSLVLSSYLNQLASYVWDIDPMTHWPYSVGEATSGATEALAVVEGTEGSIGYVLSTQTDGAGTANVGAHGVYYQPTDESVAELVVSAKREPFREMPDLVYQLDPTGDGYPITHLSYMLVCRAYLEADTTTLMKGYLSYIVSPAGQQLARDEAGSVPVPSKLEGILIGAIERMG